MLKTSSCEEWASKIYLNLNLYFIDEEDNGAISKISSLTLLAIMSDSGQSFIGRKRPYTSNGSRLFNIVGVEKGFGLTGGGFFALLFLQSIKEYSLQVSFFSNKELTLLLV